MPFLEGDKHIFCQVLSSVTQPAKTKQIFLISRRRRFWRQNAKSNDLKKICFFIFQRHLESHVAVGHIRF